jgi:SNF2 family DNA or RNA helicase
MTATLKSKSPLNVYDQFNFLKEDYFPETMYEFAERYCIMETLRFSQGRRVLITENDYTKIRDRLADAWQRGGEKLLTVVMGKVADEYGINFAKQRHIMEHREYAPFINQQELLDRIAPVTMRVRRKDVFDVTHDHFVKHPIMRPVELSDEAKRIANELVKLGFTDNFTLDKAPALELFIRLQDVCNGFEPIEREADYDTLDCFAEKPKRIIDYRPLSVNPKLDALTELLEEIDVENNQVVVWSSRKLLIRACKDRFEAEGLSFVVYDGSANEKEKAEAERRFMSNEARVFLANPASGAYGLNCLARCAYAVYICINDSVEQYYQSLHRILRGQLTAPKFTYHLYARGTVEERQLRSLAVGRELIEERNHKSLFVCA